MNIESVTTLFQLFSGEDDTEKYQPIISLAVSETEKMLADGADITDVRLEFLCAAIANYRLQQINAAHDRSESTYAGKLVTSPENSGALGYAEKLLADYMNLCSGLIKPRTFVFMSFGSETEVQENAQNGS
ncbi:MAG: hypothetical protein IJX77_02340 [Ruminococcus sp.]|nr:hypothetical protein [Ruminococcus sp.]